MQLAAAYWAFRNALEVEVNGVHAWWTAETGWVRAVKPHQAAMPCIT